ncbi:MAG: hypothetical protein Fur0018_06310 [Anaerolineales bacterium]
MSITGKGYYIWKIAQCEGGNVQAIAQTARQAGLTYVLIKVANGVSTYNFDWQHKIDMVPPLVQALKAQGLQAWGWQYVYGNDPLQEADMAIARVTQLGLDGFIVNAEAEYKQPGKAAAAETYMKRLRKALPNTPLGLSSYRFPSYHPQLPWKEFLTYCDYNMPQVYWMQNHNPAAQLRQTVREFQGRTPMRPLVPTGATFSEHNWTPAETEVLEFLNTAQSLNLPAVNFWSWDAARPALPSLWTVVANFPWGGQPLPEPDIAERFVTALNTHDPDKVAALYHDDAVHVNAVRSVSGKINVRTWYATLFQQILPQATFTLSGYSGAGNSRHLTWEANSTAGTVRTGNDTLGLRDGKIYYHYTFFKVEP